jgi:hypothetical protein
MCDISHGGLENALTLLTDYFLKGHYVLGGGTTQCHKEYSKRGKIIFAVFCNY